MRARLLSALIVVAAFPGAPSVPAADLVIGRAAEQSSLDPLFSRTGNNQATADHLFDRLVDNDANNQMHPALAVSWRVVTPTTWEIRLREGVRFHDGSEFTADDVAFSLERAKGVPNSPASYAGAVRGITDVRVVSRHLLEVRTAEPLPQLMEQVANVFIMSRKAATGLSTGDFNAGKGLVGTGPYVFVEWAKGQRLVLKANPAYWGRKPEFTNVTMRFIPKDAARVAALLSGDVDLIDQVHPSNVKQLQGGKTQVFSIASGRLIYLALDSDRDQPPFLTDVGGAKLDRNPLKDPRVRRAISVAIDRKALVDRLLEGSGEPAGQMVPRGIGGHDPALLPPAVDPALARKLLSEAGYPNGFGITLHSSADRFPRDADLVQALGQMLARGGLKVNGVQAVAYNVYAGAASKREYSAFVFSFGTTTPTSAIGLLNVLATFDREAGTGAFNRSRYSNREFDAALKKALSEFDERKRSDALAAAARIAFNDTAIVPLYWQVVHWAARKGISYEPRRDEATIATGAALAR
jgi:peptide/nickel transport system substrate-binding protein